MGTRKDKKEQGQKELQSRAPTRVMSNCALLVQTNIIHPPLFYSKRAMNYPRELDTSRMCPISQILFAL